MPAGDLVQIGKSFRVGFNGAVWTGYQLTALTRSKTANVETILDNSGATTTHVITNPGDQIAITANIEDADGNITPPDVGDFLSVTLPGDTLPTAWCLLSPATVTHGNGVTTISATLTREDSMATIYDDAVFPVFIDSTATWSLSSPVNVDFSLILRNATDTITYVKNGATTLSSSTQYNVIGSSPSRVRTIRMLTTYIDDVLTAAGQTVTLTIKTSIGSDFTFTITAKA